MTTAGAPLVAVRLPAGPAWLQTANDLWDRGAAVLPLPHAGPPPAIAALLETLRPSTLIDEEGMHALDGGEPVPEGTAAVITTSGSTGAPKGVVLSHAALEASAGASLRRLGATSDDRWLCCLPLHHVAGVQVLVRSRLLGVEPVVHARFDLDAVAAQRDVSMVALVPTMLRRLLDAGTDLSHLRCVLLGGGAPGPVLDDAQLAGVAVTTTYGMTETAGGCVYDGVPLDGAKVIVASDGRIVLRGPMVADGYHRRPDLTAEAFRDGWFCTQDLGRRTPDGRLEVVGRADDIIVTGGENVPAAWVVELLEGHPAVAEAAVIGREDPRWGQRIVAYVVAQGVPPTLPELRAFVAQRTSRHVAPRELVLVETIPRLSSGKVDRLALLSEPARP